MSSFPISGSRKAFGSSSTDRKGFSSDRFYPTHAFGKTNARNTFEGKIELPTLQQQQQTVQQTIQQQTFQQHHKVASEMSLNYLKTFAETFSFSFQQQNSNAFCFISLQATKLKG